MLGKLIRHEFRATGRIMLPVMGAMVILALLANLSLKTMANAMPDYSLLRIFLVLIVVFFGVAVVATAVMALILMVSRFYQNLLKDEGYLMFTLPAGVHELVWAKLIVSAVWFVVTGLLIFLVLSLTVLNLSETNLQVVFADFPSWKEIQGQLDALGIRGQLNLIVFQILLMALTAIFTTCLHFYAAMSLGHMFAKNKVLLSVVFYVGISFLFSMLTSGYGFAWAQSFPGQHVVTEASADALRVMSAALWHAVGISLVQAALMYLATVFSLKKGLNLA